MEALILSRLSLAGLLLCAHRSVIIIRLPVSPPCGKLSNRGPHIEAPSPAETLLVPFLTAEYYLELLGGNKG